MSLPPLPKNISSNGQEIWDWAANLKNEIHRRDKVRRLHELIWGANNKCGSCRLWMTKQCPRETHDNRIGRRRGPSCDAPKCSAFVMTAHSAENIDEWRAELVALTSKPTTNEATEQVKGGV